MSSSAGLSPIRAKLVFDATRKCIQCVINEAQQEEGQRVTGAIMGCGQQANQRASWGEGRCRATKSQRVVNHWW